MKILLLTLTLLITSNLIAQNQSTSQLILRDDNANQILEVGYNGDLTVTDSLLAIKALIKMVMEADTTYYLQGLGIISDRHGKRIFYWDDLSNEGKQRLYKMHPVSKMKMLTKEDLKKIKD